MTAKSCMCVCHSLNEEELCPNCTKPEASCYQQYQAKVKQGEAKQSPQPKPVEPAPIVQPAKNPKDSRILNFLKTWAPIAGIFLTVATALYSTHPPAQQLIQKVAGHIHIPVPVASIASPLLLALFLVAGVKVAKPTLKIVNTLLRNSLVEITVFLLIILAFAFFPVYIGLSLFFETSATPIVSQQSFDCLEVDYSKPLPEMISAGKYDWVNSDINSEHFPLSPIPTKVEPQVELVHFNQCISSDNAIAELKKRGMRPATLPELLAFGEKYPEEQRKYPIVALGSVWRDWLDRHVPYLWHDPDRRCLNLDWFGRDWLGYYRFLAVRES